ncbi:MAG TPA: hypothetical protein VF771_02995, partial [Longimicrobiaceae bacterium]
MSTPANGNARILADQQAFLDACERAREAFGGIEGVVSVGYGQKESGGRFSDDLAIVVFVREKKPEEELAPAERIPPAFEGYRTDVAQVPDAVQARCGNTDPYPVIQGGIQITPPAREDGTYQHGTLGCIVRRRGDTGRENVYLLTCRHVLFEHGRGAGEYAYHPFPPPRGTDPPDRPSHPLGPISAEAFRENFSYTPPGASAPDDFWIDCATARIDIDSKCLGSTCRRDVVHCAGTIAGLALGADDPATPGVREDELVADVRSVIGELGFVGQRVHKVGRTTGKTTGIVRRVNATANVPRESENPAGPKVVACHVMHVELDPASDPSHTNCLGRDWFAEQGDSGSVVVDDDRRVVGLLFGAMDLVTNGQLTPAPRFAFVSHIYPVLDRLGICVLATGTSSRTTGATDGTGTAPAAAAGGGGGGFTSARVEGDMVRPAPTPVTVSAAEQERLLRLRDAFRATARGRELHETFASVRREVGYLVRNARPVKVAWHRSQGPAFLACTLEHL